MNRKTAFILTALFPCGIALEWILLLVFGLNTFNMLLSLIGVPFALGVASEFGVRQLTSKGEKAHPMTMAQEYQRLSRLQIPASVILLWFFVGSLFNPFMWMLLPVFLILEILNVHFSGELGDDIIYRGIYEDEWLTPEEGQSLEKRAHLHTLFLHPFFAGRLANAVGEKTWKL